MKHVNILVVILMLASMLAACNGDPEPQVIEKEVTKVVKETVVETITETVIVEGTPQTVEQQVTRVVEVEKIVTAVPEAAQGPAPGGGLIIAADAEADTLDAHRSTMGAAAMILTRLGAALVAVDPFTNEYVPWLAESWTVSEDGTAWEFKLREDVKFHDGTPLTAHDYAWTINRALDPENPAPTTGTLLMGAMGAEAVDDYTLQLNMAYPNQAILTGLSTSSWLQPMSQAYVEEMGDDYARHPIGVGPYMFKEWSTGEKIILERNPDYIWGPAWTEGQPAYIETIEYRIIPEYATQIAGLEAGDVDMMSVQPKDLERVAGLDQFSIYESPSQGFNFGLYMNMGREVFQDLKLRQAFNYAIDRDVIIKVHGGGHGMPQFGPISPSVFGYWPGVEYVGYNYDLDKAKALMAEAGWEDSDGNGILEKDGEPLKLELNTDAAFSGNLGEILQGQLRELGVDVDLLLLEQGVSIQEVGMGNYDLSISGIGWPDCLLVWGMFHSDMIGVFNSSQLSDPELDPIVANIVFTNSAEVSEESCNEAQRYVVEHAYVIPTYAPIAFTALNDRVMGETVSPVTGDVYLHTAYIETGPAE